MRKRILGCTILAIGMTIAGCGEPTSDRETAVRQLLETAEEAAEARDSDRLLAMVSEDFDGPHGIGRKAHLRRLLDGRFVRNESIHLYTTVHEIEFPTSDRAEVTLAVAMAGRPMGSESRVRELNADVYRFNLSLERLDGEWKARQASWERASPAELLP